MAYRVYYHPHLPMTSVLERIVVAKGRLPIWSSWTTSTWKGWESPRRDEFFKAMLDSIIKEGIKKPVLLWDYAVVSGGTRLMCARALGKTNIPALLSLRDDLGEPPAGARRLDSIHHPEILGHNPDMIIWQKDQPLYLSYPAWDYRKPTATACSSGVVSFRGKPPSSSKR